MTVNRVIIALFILGIFVPTSINQSITLTFVRPACALLLVALVVMLIKQGKTSLSSLFVLLMTNGLLLLFTMTSPWTEYRFLSGLYFFILTLMFCIDFTTLKLDFNAYRRALLFVSLVFSWLSFSVIFSHIPTMLFIQNWYSAFFDQLLPTMFATGRPVNTFATHSIAGFYLFVFFVLNFITYMQVNKKIHLLISLIFMFFLINIQSTTSLIYFLVCFAVILVVLYKKSAVGFFIAISSLFVFVLANYDRLLIFSVIYEKLFNSNNGLAIRYADEGVLETNIGLILQNPFRGFGLSFSPDAPYIDSGLVEYSLRGSVLFLLIFLFGVLFFFTKNLGKTQGALLFLLFLSFEFGFSNFVYFRSLFIIPFVVAYLVQLRKQKELSCDSSFYNSASQFTMTLFVPAAGAVAKLI